MNRVSSAFIALFLSLVCTEAFAQSSAITGIESFAEFLSREMTRNVDNLSIPIQNASKYLLVLMATLDLVFFVVLNVQSWSQQGIAVLLPEMFKRLVIWSVLLYGITTLTGESGAQEIRQMAADLTGNAGVSRLTPSQTMVLGLNSALSSVNGIGASIVADGFWATVFDAITLKYLLFLILSVISVLVTVAVFAVLATKMLLFQLGSSLVMLFAGVGFALAAFSPFRSWGTNVVSSMIKMVIHLATIFVVALFIARVLITTQSNIVLSTSAINVETANWIVMSFVLMGIVGLYLAIALPSMVQQFVGGGGAQAGETAGNAVGGLAAAGLAAGLGAAATALTKAAKSITGGGNNDGGGDDGDEGGEEGGGGDYPVSSRGQDADQSSIVSRAKSGANAGADVGSNAGPVGIAVGAGVGAVAGGVAGAADDAVDAAGDAVEETADTVAEQAEANKSSLAERAKAKRQAQSGDSGGDSGSGSSESDSDDELPASNSPQNVADDEGEEGTSNVRSSSSGGSTSESGDSGESEGDAGDAGNEVGSTSSRNSSKDSVVEETVDDNVRVEKRAGSNNIQQAGTDDGENEANLANQQSGGSARSSSVEVEDEESVSVNRKTTVTKTENNSNEEK